MTIRPRRSVLYMPGVECARARKGEDAALRRRHSRPRGFRRARRQGGGAPAGRGRGEGRRLRRARGDRAHQCARHPVVARRPQPPRPRRGPTRILVPKISTAGRSRGDRGASRRHRRRRQDQAVGDGGDAARDHQRRRDRGRRRRRGDRGSPASSWAPTTSPRRPAPGSIPGRAPMLPWLSHCVLAARAFGIDILDGVYNDIADIEGFRRECAQGRDMGFDGKTLIHPNQIEPCNAAFSPTADEIDAGAQDHRRVRPAGEPRQGRGADRRPHGRTPACGDGAAHGRDRGGDRGAGQRGRSPARRMQRGTR